MIENIRKYKGIIIFGLALVIFALVIGIKDDLFHRGGGGHPVIKIAGRSYDDKEFSHLGSSGFELASTLGQSREFGFDPTFFQFVMRLMDKSATTRDSALESFFVGRMILRQAKEEFGVYPGDEEISAAVRKLRAFAGPDGQFNQETYRTFIEKGIGRLGLTEGDFRELVSDMLASEKISAIVGSGLTTNRDALALSHALDSQQIDGELASLKLADFKAKIQPTDDEVKTYWDTIKDQFQTEPRRKFSYLIATPDMPAESAASKDAAKESLADAAATDEQKKQKEAEKAKKDAELADARRKAQVQLDTKVDDFAFQLEEQKGAGLEDLAKANGWEIKASEFFPQSQPPKDLDVALRGASRGGKAADVLFQLSPTTDPVSKITQPIAIGENQWLIARLDGEEKARPKTFDEAKEEARTQYIAEKAAEALKKAANEARDKIKASMASGKSFADAAKEAGLTTKAFAKVTRSYRPDAATEPRNLFDSTRNVDPGSLADLVVQGDHAFIPFVAKREVVKAEDPAALLDGEVNSSRSTNEMYAFSGWLAARVEAAHVERLYQQR